MDGIAILAVGLTPGAIISKAIALLGSRLFQFAMIAVVFIPLERLIPFHPKQRLFRARFGLDLLHYFLGGIFIIAFVRATYLFMPIVSGRTGIHISPVNVSHLPGWAQLVVFEVGWTFLGYWLHRLEHAWRPLWRIHSIHESTLELDWLSAFRLHPLEPVLFQVATIVPLWFFGMSHPIALTYTIYSYIFAHVQHSNVVFPIGPLKYILPTPEFHRWHHARIRNADGSETPSLVNFGQYPIWDHLFGTFYLPATRPTEYGSSDGDRIPMDYLAQMLYPFGGHEKLLAWKRSVSERFWFSDRITKIRAASAPIHDAFEDRLARLCLLPSNAAADSPMISMQPYLGKEES